MAIPAQGRTKPAAFRAWASLVPVHKKYAQGLPGLRRQLQPPPSRQTNRFVDLGHHHRNRPGAQSFLPDPEKFPVATGKGKDEPPRITTGNQPPRKDPFSLPLQADPQDRPLLTGTHAGRKEETPRPARLMNPAPFQNRSKTGHLARRQFTEFCIRSDRMKLMRSLHIHALFLSSLQTFLESVCR